MKKTIQILDKELMEEFMCILSIGLLESIKKKAISPSRAEQWLFSPVIAYSVKAEQYSKAFKDALELASETEAASHCSNFEHGLTDNQKLFLEIVQTIEKNNFNGISFLGGLMDE